MVHGASQNKKNVNGQGEKPWRIRLLAFFVLVCFGIFSFRLYGLQILDGRTYADVAQGQHLKQRELDAERGEILLKEGKEIYPVAINQELQMAYVVPREIADIETAVAKIAKLVAMDEQEVREKIGDGQGVFRVLKHRLSEEEVALIKAEKPEGLHLMGEKFRYYPAAELAAQVVGFVGSDGDKRRGMYGIESSLEEVLRGRPGKVWQEGDASGRWISVSDRKLDPSEDGADVLLTIEHAVQYEVEKILKESLEKFAADAGSAVVLDPQTGKILAMANMPTFNPNDFSKVEDVSLFVNQAVSTPYESGSVFKPLTMAMGVDSGKVNAGTTFSDPGSVREAGFEIKNSEGKAYGTQTMTGVLENSINTGMIFVEKLLGNKKFADYVDSFGFGHKTGVELPGESAGNVANLANHKRDINFFTASFGQGITVTPLQLATTYAAIANGGRLLKPHIVESLRYPDGRTEDFGTEEVRQVLSASAAREVAVMLRSVVVNGHGKRADVPGYKVCGKTGTAQVAKQGAKGYEEGMNIGSFAGFAPLDDPKFVVIVKLYNPKNVEWAESSAAPTFGEIMKFLLKYYEVPPTEDPASSPQAKLPPLKFLDDSEKKEEKVEKEEAHENEKKN